MTRNHFHRILICTALVLLLGAPAAHAELIAWGTNEEDALCDGHTSAEQSYTTRWAKASELPVSAVAGGAHFVVFVSNGRAFACGSNLAGTLGREGQAPSDVPVEVPVPGTVVQVAAGEYFAVALTSTGAVYEWGYGSPSVRQIVGVTANSIAAGAGFASAALTNGHVVNWGEETAEQFCNRSLHGPGETVEMLGVTEARQVADGWWDVYVLRQNGEVLSCGDNQGGMLGDGSEGDAGQEGVLQHVAGAAEIREIAATRQQGIAVTDGGALYEWGALVGDDALAQSESLWPVRTVDAARTNGEMLSGASLAAANEGLVTWGGGANLAGYKVEEGPGQSALTAPVTTVGPGWYDDYAGGGGAPSPKVVKFTSWRLTGSLLDQKQRQSLALAGSLNGQAALYGPLETTFDAPPVTNEMRLFGIVPVGLDVGFASAGALRGNIGAGYNAGELAIRNVGGTIDMEVTGISLLGLSIPMSCQTPVKLEALAGEVPAALTGLSFRGNANIASGFQCEGGLLGKLFADVLDALLAGTENQIAVAAEP